MFSEKPSRFVHEIALSGNGAFRMAFDVVGVVSLRYKAQLLRIGRMRDRKPGLLRDAPDFLFRQISEGKERARKLFLRQLIEHIGLVFSGVRRPSDCVASVIQA